MKVQHFVLADQVVWHDAESEFRLTRPLPSAIRVLNPTPGSAATLLTVQFGLSVVDLQPGEQVSATLEVAHEKGTWVALGTETATLGPADRFWILVSTFNFPPAREGVFKIRMTVRAESGSQRVVRKIGVRFTPSN